MPRPAILAIQHAPQEPLGTLGMVLERRGFTVDEVHVYGPAKVPSELGAHRGLVIMGGPMGVYEAARYPFLNDELRLIESALREGVPVLGICLGAQLLAAALGARVYPSGKQEIGWYPLTLTPEAADDPLFVGVASPLQAFHWHGDTYTLPNGAVRLASSELTPEQGFRHGSSAYGLQFHLEVTTQIVLGMEGAGAPELEQAKVNRAQLEEGAVEYGEALEAVAESVFGRWCELILR